MADTTALRAEDHSAAYNVVPLRDKAKAAKHIIERYLDGERIESIAKQYGVSRIRLYQILAEEAPEEWKSAQLGGALDRLDAAQEMMDSATDMLNISRARESGRMAQWMLERVCRRIYGQDAPVAQINVHIGAVDARIEALQRELGLLVAAQARQIEDAQIVEDAQVVDDTGNAASQPA